MIDNYADNRFHHWFGEAKIALCFRCSEVRNDHIHVPVLSGPQWKRLCLCWYYHDPVSDISPRDPERRGLWLCDDCRQKFISLKFAERRRRLERAGHQMRDATENGMNGLYRFVHDGDRWNRNYCLCGRNVQEILDSLPISDAAEAITGTQIGGPDRRYVYRMCLDCEGHVWDPYTQLNTHVPAAGWSCP